MDRGRLNMDGKDERGPKMDENGRKMDENGPFMDEKRLKTIDFVLRSGAFDVSKSEAKKRACCISRWIESLARPVHMA